MLSGTMTLSDRRQLRMLLHDAISYKLSAFSYQPSAISYQLSAISYQASAPSHQPSTFNLQPLTFLRTTLYAEQLLTQP
jgi:hypothetical protein